LRDGRRNSVGIPDRSAYEEPARRAGELIGEGLEAPWRTSMVMDVDPGRAALATVPDLAVHLLRDRRQRLPEREVEVHRPGAVPDRRRVRAASEGAEVDGRVARWLVVAHLHEPLGEPSVEPDLVDGLAGADIAKLGRAVGGHHDQ